MIPFDWLKNCLGVDSYHPSSPSSNQLAFFMVKIEKSLNGRWLFVKGKNRY
jgi:hypothetical protein